MSGASRHTLYDSLRHWYRRRPRLTAWAVLATGMLLVVLLFGRDAGLTLGQQAALAALTLPLAWACTWIIFLEGDG